MLTKKRILFFLSFLACGYLAASLGIYFLNDRFLISHVLIKDKLPLTSKEKTEFSELFSSSFYYLAQGSQMYAFISEDGKYILKLTKQNRLRFFKIPSSRLLASFQKKIQSSKELEKNNKRKKLYQSCQIAWNELRNECGLLVFGMGTCKPEITITLFDKLGREYQIPLSSTDFMLQQKGELISPTLKGLIHEGKIAEAKKRLDELYSLLLLRCQKGIFDEDASISKNAGFLEDRAIYLDIGGFSKETKMKNPNIYKQEIEKISLHFMHWLDMQNEELALHYKNKIYQFIF